MSKTALLVLSAIAIELTLFFGSTFGQTTRPMPGDLVNRLLELPAPRPLWDRSRNGGIPTDDAPIDQLLAFWSSEDAHGLIAPAGPSEAVRRRLLGGCIEHPDKLLELLWGLPASSQAVDVVKVIYDTHEKEKIWDDAARLTIHKWLRQRSGHFRDELIVAARSFACRRDEYGFTVDNEEDLRALAQMDWATARPILESFAEAKDLHVAAVALQLLAQHAMAAQDQGLAALLVRLRKIADDRGAPPFARDRAFTLLESIPWDGRDGWYLSLFAYAALRELLENRDGFQPPLDVLIAGDPDHYVPLVVKLLDSKDSITRDNAVWELLKISRADALRPLLPALNNAPGWPDWTRASLLPALGRVNLPECVPAIVKAWPGLSEDERVDAAFALARQNAKEAPAMLKAAFLGHSRRMNYPEQWRLAEAIIASNALSDDEILAAMEAFCAENVEAARRREAGDDTAFTLSPQAMLGDAMLQFVDHRQDLAEKLLRRADALEVSRPAIAIDIRRVLAKWPVPAVDADLVARITRKDLDEAIITTALDRLPGIGFTQADALRALAQRGGPKAALAAVLLGDGASIHSILHGNDPYANAFLLATARLAGTKLPITDVTACLDVKDPAVSRAAEQYLIDQDTAETRGIVMARHPGQLLIFGAPVFPPPPEPAGASHPLDRIEQLRAEMQGKDAPDAIYAMVNDGWGLGNDGQRVIRIRGAHTVISRESKNGRVQSRELTANEIKSLLDLLATNKFDDLPDLDNGMDEVWYDYLHLTRQSGRRIYINGPGFAGTAGTPYDLVTTLFRTLSSTGTFTIHYRAQESARVLQVLSSSDDQPPIAQAWRQGNDIRVWLFSAQAGSRWHAFRNGRVAEPVAAPAGAPKFDSKSEVPDGFDINWDLCSPYWSAASGQDVILPGNRSGALRGGLWRCRAGKTPQRITAADCEFARLMTTADGKWAVAPESANRWAQPCPFVRVRLSDGDMHPFDLPADRRYEALARFPDGRIMVYGWKDIGNKQNRLYWLVDPITGHVESIVGDFLPLEQTSGPLQPTLQNDVVWATEFDNEKTRIGRYNLRLFKFTPLVTLAEMHLSSGEIWVDEAEGIAYFWANGDLLSVPVRQ